MENLAEKELVKINGGSASVLGPLGIKLSITSSVNSLLSITVNTTFGSKQSEHTLTVGENIDFGLATGNIS